MSDQHEETPYIFDDDQIENPKIKNAGAAFLEEANARNRRVYFSLARSANNGGLTRAGFAQLLHQTRIYNQLTRAEAIYCAGWAALAAQKLEDVPDEEKDAALVVLLQSGVGPYDNPEIMGG